MRAWLRGRTVLKFMALALMVGCQLGPQGETVCPTPTCCDRYVPKCFPDTCGPAPGGRCDDYCRKCLPDVCVPMQSRPDDYCEKPFPDTCSLGFGCGDGVGTSYNSAGCTRNQ